MWTNTPLQDFLSEVCIPDTNKDTNGNYALTQASVVSTDWRSSTLPTD